MSLGNLWRRKLRTILTVWGMSVGVGAMVLLISFAAGLQKENEKQILSSASLTQLTAAKEKSNGFSRGDATSADVKLFDAADLATIRHMPHVLAAYPAIFLPPVKVAFKDKRYDAFLQPTAMELITDTKKSELSAGSWWTKNGDQAIVVSTTTLEQWKIAAEDIINQPVKIISQNFSVTGVKDGNTYDVTVVGVSKQNVGFGGIGGDAIAEDLAEKIARESVSSFNETQGDPNHWANLTVFVDTNDHVAEVRKSIEDAGWFASGLEELLKDINQAFLIMKIILGVIGGIALFVALIGITNSMLMAVLERTREIGIMAAIGASRRTISGLFLSESAWLGAFGALFGLLGAFLIGKGIVAGINTYLKISGQADTGGLNNIQFYVGWPLALATFGGAVIITLLAGWIPASRAARQDPVKALRHE